MSKADSFENDLLKHVFNNSAISLVGDATGLRGSTAAGSLYISLHTANPNETGTQSTSESAYTSYARVAVTRSNSFWSVTNNNVTNISAVNFPMCTGGTETITHFGVGTDVSGTGKLLYWGALDASLAVSNGVTPSFGATSMNINED